MSSPAVRVPKAAALIAARLRARVVRGELQPGDPLPGEQALCREFGVSRPTLREALRVLEAEGLIAVKRGAHGGARVLHPGPDVAARHAALSLRLQGTTVDDVAAARRVIEPAAVRLLAMHAADQPAILDPLEVAHREAARAMGDDTAYAHASIRFHQRLIELCGNRTLTLAGLILMEIVAPSNHATFEAVDHRDEVERAAQTLHGHVLVALRDGDADRAEDLWVGHLDEVTQHTLARLGRDVPVELLEAAGAAAPDRAHRSA